MKFDSAWAEKLDHALLRELFQRLEIISPGLLDNSV